VFELGLLAAFDHCGFGPWDAGAVVGDGEFDPRAPVSGDLRAGTPVGCGRPAHGTGPELDLRFVATVFERVLDEFGERAVEFTPGTDPVVGLDGHVDGRRRELLAVAGRDVRQERPGVESFGLALSTGVAFEFAGPLAQPDDPVGGSGETLAQVRGVDAPVVVLLKVTAHSEDDVHLVAEVVPEHPVEQSDELFGPFALGDVGLEPQETRHVAVVVGDRADPDLVPERRPVGAVVDQFRRDRLGGSDALAESGHRLVVGGRALQEPAVATHEFAGVVAGQPLEPLVGVDQRRVRPAGVGDRDADAGLVHRPRLQPEFPLAFLPGGDVTADPLNAGDRPVPGHRPRVHFEDDDLAVGGHEIEFAPLHGLAVEDARVGARRVVNRRGRQEPGERRTDEFPGGVAQYSLDGRRDVGELAVESDAEDDVETRVGDPLEPAFLAFEACVAFAAFALAVAPLQRLPDEPGEQLDEHRLRLGEGLGALLAVGETDGPVHLLVDEYRRAHVRPQAEGFERGVGNRGRLGGVLDGQRVLPFDRPPTVGLVQRTALARLQQFVVPRRLDDPLGVAVDPREKAERQVQRCRPHFQAPCDPVVDVSLPLGERLVQFLSMRTIAHRFALGLYNLVFRTLRYHVLKREWAWDDARRRAAHLCRSGSVTRAMAPWYAWTPWGGEFWVARLLLQRGLALTYLVAFLVAARQFRPLAGEDGLLPLSQYTGRYEFRQKPSLFYYLDSDRALAAGAWLGVGLATLALLGVPGRFGTPAYVLVWTAMWALYLSFVNAGGTFYGYGWESMLCECGFLAIFLGTPDLIAPAVVVYLFRWVEFRNMFGAGLIKLRGDDCWRDLTCLEYHYETQPMPNPLSWVAHRLPTSAHKVGVAVNHVVELAVPFLYFGPPRVAALAGFATVGFQGWLMLTGNFSFLNFLTIVMAGSLFADSVVTAGVDILDLSRVVDLFGLSRVVDLFGLSGVVPSLPPIPAVTGLAPLSLPHQVALAALLVLVVALSYYPVVNMLSSSQAMNRAFDPLNLVNTYGAFGSITRNRYEVVVQGTHDETVTDDTEWETYTFPGKPTDPERLPRQWAPYHLRLDWQLWFAAMASSPRRSPWFVHLLAKLLAGDEATHSLLRENPFPDPDDPPTHVRALRYRYEFTDLETLRETGRWWDRERVGTYYGPVSLADPRFRSTLRRQGWDVPGTDGDRNSDRTRVDVDGLADEVLGE